MAYGNARNLTFSGTEMWQRWLLGVKSGLLDIQAQTGMGEDDFLKVGGQIDPDNPTDWEDTTNAPNKRFMVLQFAHAWSGHDPMQVLIGYVDTYDSSATLAGYSGLPRGSNNWGGIHIKVAPFGGWDPVTHTFPEGVVQTEWRYWGQDGAGYAADDQVHVFAYSGAVGQPGWIAVVAAAAGVTDNVWALSCVFGAGTPLYAGPAADHGFVVYGNINAGVYARTLTGQVVSDGGAHAAALFGPHYYAEPTTPRAVRAPVSIDDTTSARTMGVLAGLRSLSAAVGTQYDEDLPGSLIRFGALAFPKVG